MMKIIPFLALVLFILRVNAETPETTQTSEESVLKLELSEQENAKKEFQQLVQSTMAVMGPGVEMTELTSPTTDKITK